MLWQRTFRAEEADQACRELLDAWRQPDKKVFLLRPLEDIREPRSFYESLFPKLGRAAAFAEDVKIGDRGHQRTGQVWMEVRYDPKFKDAYRHSASAQPLHTDGSYIPDYPNASLMVCVKSAGQGGETTFLHARDLIEIVGREKPELMPMLEAPLPHTRTGDTRTEPIIDRNGGTTLLNWNYYCVDRAASADLTDKIECFQDLLNGSQELRERLVQLKLQPGDAVAWKDREVLHGRNAFEASEESDRFLWKCAINIGAL